MEMRQLVVTRPEMTSFCQNWNIPHCSLRPICSTFSHFFCGASIAWILADMDALTMAAASGMKARMESLDMLANNIANSSTAGFKADREFYSLYMSEAATAAPDGPAPTEAPLIERRWTDFSQGSLLSTNNPLDLAISGKGFFVVESPSGPLGTRSGNFHWKAGSLETVEGHRLRILRPDGTQAQLDPEKAVDVSPTGVVQQGGQEMGRIQITELDNTSAASKLGNTYFKIDNPKPVATEIRQGALESSNVPVAESAVRLVSVMRQFEMLQRALTLGSEMNRKAVEEVAKVS